MKFLHMFFATILAFAASVLSAEAQRVAVRTNAFDWLFVIPNIGLEYRLTEDPYKYMTLGLNAKYNWNTWHATSGNVSYNPPSVYNLLDIRPEFRYYSRPFNSKNQKTWRAQYIGAYANYADYAFKLGEYGLRGHNTFGLGASLGYVLPLYEYKKGAIDVDLGFSVGLIFAKHDAFTHSMDGDYYTRLAEGEKYFSLTQSSSRVLPYPIVSEVRVAFVWRRESLRYHIQKDYAKEEEKQRLERNLALVMKDLESIMPIKYKYRFDNENKDEVKEWKKIDEIYRLKFAAAVSSQKEDVLIQINDPHKAFKWRQLKKLYKIVDKREQEILREFERLWAEEKRRKK